MDPSGAQPEKEVYWEKNQSRTQSSTQDSSKVCFTMRPNFWQQNSSTSEYKLHLISHTTCLLSHWLTGYYLQKPLLALNDLNNSVISAFQCSKGKWIMCRPASAWNGGLDSLYSWEQRHQGREAATGVQYVKCGVNPTRILLCNAICCLSPIQANMKKKKQWVSATTHTAFYEV